MNSRICTYIYTEYIKIDEPLTYPRNAFEMPFWHITATERTLAISSGLIAAVRQSIASIYSIL